METSGRSRRVLSVTLGGSVLVVAVVVAITTAARPAHAGWLFGRHNHCNDCCDGQSYCSGPGDIYEADSAGNWYWMRSPEQEKRMVMNIFNRYCIRCHGVDGRGVWDIPDVPDFTNVRWQISRPDAYRARVIMEGRGAVMPTFRGTLTLEEAWAMARYLHSFVPGTEVSREDVSSPANQPVSTPEPPAPTAAAPLPPAASPSPNPGIPVPLPR
jgi:cbb3-type cytochrome c oxidase subunit III